MPEAHSLLTEPLLRIRRPGDGAGVALTLPALFAVLATDGVRDFPGLRPHQRHPWHAFLVQLAAIALHADGADTPYPDAADWQRALGALTPDPAGWCLVAAPERPAFLQPPVAGGDLADWHDDTPTPDALDLLITSKNHELKGERMAAARADDWVFALVSLQTAAPYPGPKNYGISRMNGAFSSRPGLGVEPGGGPGARWRRDLRIALAQRQRLVDEVDGYGYRDQGGQALLWLAPWDGKAAFGFAALDPFYIEVCRRVRLVADAAGVLRACRCGTAGPRITKGKGNTGDLWTPVEKAGAKSLGVSAEGFHYKRMVQLLFGAEYRRPPAQELGADDDTEGLVIVARAIAGGQSTTDGYHERRVPVSRSVRRRLIAHDTDPLAALAQQRIKAIEQVCEVLRIALAILFAKGASHKEIKKPHKDLAGRFVERFERAEDSAFFDGEHGVIAEFEATDQDAVRRAWHLALAAAAAAELERAFAAGPSSGERRYRARAAALRRLHWGLRGAKVPPELAAALRAADQPQSQPAPETADVA